MTTAAPAGQAYNEFPIGAVLTVTCGSADRIFCTYGEQLRILGYMAGHVPPPEDTQAYIDAAKPAVLQQYPALKVIVAPTVGAPDAVVLAWLQQQETNFGATLTLEPLPATP